MGESAATVRLRDSIQRLARVRPRGVLVVGEPGAGKTWTAQALHAASPRREAPCLLYPCDGAYAPSVALFGASGSGGLLAAAQDGTLVLDDIERLDPALQIQLLEWLDRARGQVPLVVGVSTATTHDSPLLSWLGRAVLEVSPLRDRTADILVLARHFLGLSTASASPASFTRAAEQQLLRHAWPGNVRELRDTVRRAVALAGPVVDAQHLGIGAPPTTPPAFAANAEPRPLREVADAYIEHVLALTGGNKTRAARLLGVARETLRHHVGVKNGRT